MYASVFSVDVCGDRWMSVLVSRADVRGGPLDICSANSTRTNGEMPYVHYFLEISFG
jgi:hypothetical protein